MSKTYIDEQQQFKKLAELAIKMYYDSCDQMAQLVNHQLFDGERAWYWIADEKGGVADFEGTDVLSAADMARILRTGMTYAEYAEWRDANIEHKEYVNLYSWLKGLRHSMIKDGSDDTATV